MCKVIATLSDSQVKSLLQGKKILVKGLKGKKGGYDAYLILESVEDFSVRKMVKKSMDSSISLRWNFHRRRISRKNIFHNNL